MRNIAIAATFCQAAVFISPPAAGAEPVNIVSWNAEVSIYEGIEKRRADFVALNRDLSPDVLVLTEVAGKVELEAIVGALGWERYHAAISDFDDITNNVYFGLEVAVVSKIPIVAVTEHTANVDGDVYDAFGTFAAVPTAEKLLSASGIPGVTPLAKSDRGTLRVDLENGLTIFPVHLKSNTNGACEDVSKAPKLFRTLGLETPPQFTDALANGFKAATDVHKSNALKRERVLAAVKVLADEASAQGKTVVIAGDYNTSFEPGKAGVSFKDCELKAFTCEKSLFPAEACVGDGFDDTLAILEQPLVGKTPWVYLSRALGRSYDDSAFSDLAIDHIAVPLSDKDRFSVATLGSVTYGSDHFPVTTVYTPR